MADFLARPVGEQFKQEKYEAQLAITLNAFRKKNFMCDVVLVCREKEYLAHRNVLSAASPYFRDCFSVSEDAYTCQGIFLKPFITFILLIKVCENQSFNFK